MWDEGRIRHLLERIASGSESVQSRLKALRAAPFEDIGCAKLDHHRALRQGLAEVVFCASKTAGQVAQIMSSLASGHDRVLGTRATPEQFEAARAAVPELQYDACARAIWLDRRPDAPRRPGVALLAAGTGDLPVAEEAALTLRLLGCSAERMYDVGVAGLHRLLAQVPALQGARVIIVVTGMEGALPGVVAGLVGVPVIGVPTSVGYGASFGGVSALLPMLNACAAGVAVMNIDNGYGAGHLAALINRPEEEGG